MLMLLDTFAPTYAVLVIALCECVAVAWVYGLSHSCLSVSSSTPGPKRTHLVLLYNFDNDKDIWK